MKLVDYLLALVAEHLERALTEGGGNARVLKELAEGFGTAGAGELDVFLKCGLIIVAGHLEEPKRHGLCEAVVDIVEWRLEDVHLILPSCALLKVGNALKGQVGTVLALELAVGLVALCGSVLGVLVGYVLELVNDNAVGNKGKRAAEVGVLVLFGLGEESGHSGPAEELHAHGVALGSLHTAHSQLGVAVGEAVLRGEGVTELVSDNVNIARRAVEVCEDEGLLVLIKGGAVSAAPLAVAGLKIIIIFWRK